jgi:hypothetical protein
MKNACVFLTTILIFLSGASVYAQGWYPEELAGEPVEIDSIDIRVTMLDYILPQSLPTACVQYRGCLTVDFYTAEMLIFELWGCNPEQTSFVLLQEFSPPLVQVFDWHTQLYAYVSWSDSANMSGNVLTFRDGRARFTQAVFGLADHCCPWFEFAPGTIFYEVALVVEGSRLDESMGQVAEEQ